MVEGGRVGFWAELRRRSVFRVAGVYAVTAWLIMQIVAVTMPALNLPEWFDGAVLLALAIGFPIVLIITWAFELTPEGVKRTDGGDANAPIPGFALTDVAIVVALVAVIAASAFLLVPTRSEEGGGGDTVAGGAAGAPTRDQRTSIAVLPVAELSGDPEQSPFALAFQGAVIGELGRFDWMRVIGRTSTSPYVETATSIPEIAAELGVMLLVEADMLRLGENVILQIRLIEAFPEERQIWSNAYDVPVSDLPSVQSDLVRAVVREAGGALSDGDLSRLAEQRAVDPRAYEFYTRGVGEFYDSQDRALFALEVLALEKFESAVADLREAARLDPQDPAAPTVLALAYADLGHLILPPNEAYRVTREFAIQARNIDPSLPGPHLALAEATLYNDYDLPDAEEGLRMVIEMEPSNARAHVHLAWLLDARDRPEDAEAAFRAAREHAPLNPLYASWYGWWLVGEGRYEDAMREAEAALGAAKDYPVALYVIGASQVGLGRIEEGVATHERLVADHPGWAWALAQSYVAAGEPERARPLAEIYSEDDASAFFRAIVECAVGDEDAAIASLQVALRHRHSFVPWSRRSYALGRMADNPRLDDVLAFVDYGAD